MPQHVPDNDITFVYVKELSESIRGVSGIMQTLTSELHTHALTLHQLKEQVSTLTKNVERIMVHMYDGHGSKPGLTNRLEEAERDLRDLKNEKEENKRKTETDWVHGKSLRAAIYVAIFGALLSLVGQVFTWFTKPATPASTAASGTTK